ncbi:hypothetical protein CJ030_MR6G020066 [Morella rubra]|uniref:Uncharacterized protein n=1 Tax=Morella rubra TaxID=262757 RepID=A0A6A1VDM2_9ROSI|nr:hypothetical protein CJ030_MR6G020066 [Morella rubra]
MINLKCKKIKSVFLFFHTAKTLTAAKRQAIICTHTRVVERPVSTYNFKEFQFEGRKIDEIFSHYRWDCVLFWRGPPYTNMVINFYSALQNFDTYEDKWEVYIRGRQIKISPDALSTYLCILRQVGAYPAVELATAFSPKEIFKLMTGEDQYLLQSSVSQSALPTFCRMMHLIVCHNIFQSNITQSAQPSVHK